MATTNSDLKLYYSGGKKSLDLINQGYLSLGGYQSSFVMANNMDENLFDEVTVNYAYRGLVDYRCLFVKNIHTTDTMTNLSLYITGLKDYEKIEFGVSLPDSQGKVQLLQSSFEQPYAITFYEANTEPDKVILKASLSANTMLALWLRRTILDFQTMKINFEQANPGQTFVDLTLKQKTNFAFNFDWT